MLEMIEKSMDRVGDIAYYAKDSRLSEPSDGKRYDWKKMIEFSKELDRLLTEEEIEKFRIK